MMTKKKIAWITDSTAFVTDELKQHPDLYVVPLTIIFGQEAFEDGVDLHTEELYRRINTEKEVPKTSQPSSGKFQELFDKLKESYDCAIAVHVSGKLSGTIGSCRTGAEMAEFPVEIVDSKSMSYNITTLIEIGLELENDNLDYSEIATRLRVEADKLDNYILLGSLDQFYKGGRMSGTQFLLGNILQIKPIIRINRDGEFHVYEKVRSEKKAIKRMLELFEEAQNIHGIQQIQIMHGNVLGKADELKRLFLEKHPELDILIGEISSTIAVHAGEGTVAILWHKSK